MNRIVCESKRERERIDLGLSGDVDVVELKRGAKELKKNTCMEG